jgi:hypothetical protein
MLDHKRIEQAMRAAERALKVGHPDTRAGRFNPNLGDEVDAKGKSVRIPVAGQRSADGR